MIDVLIYWRSYRHDMSARLAAQGPGPGAATAAGTSWDRLPGLPAALLQPVAEKSSSCRAS